MVHMIDGFRMQVRSNPVNYLLLLAVGAGIGRSTLTIDFDLVSLVMKTQSSPINSTVQ